MKFQKYQMIGTAVILALSLSACAPQLGSAAPTEPETQIIQSTQEATAAASAATQGWDDVVELVNMAGDSTTVYLLADGRYLDRMDRFFSYDGAETWTCDDGSIWNRKADSVPTDVTAVPSATNVNAEFAIERLLAQRPDQIFFSEGGSSKIVLTFDTAVTEFRFLELQGTVDDSGNFSCTGTRELYTCDLILSNDLMVLETSLEGLIPTRGISFKDDAGNVQYYYLALSGEDNVPLLVPFNFYG